MEPQQKTISQPWFRAILSGFFGICIFLAWVHFSRPALSLPKLTGLVSSLFLSCALIIVFLQVANQYLITKKEEQAKFDLVARWAVILLVVPTDFMLLVVSAALTVALTIATRKAAVSILLGLGTILMFLFLNYAVFGHIKA